MFSDRAVVVWLLEALGTTGNSHFRTCGSTGPGWLAVVLLCGLWGPSPALAYQEFHTVQLESLRNGVPSALASQADGAVLALHSDGTVLGYQADGRSSDEVLPVHYAPKLLPGQPTQLSELHFLVLHKPHYRYSAHFDALMDEFPKFLPWEHSDDTEGYRRVLPWLMVVIPWMREWYDYEPHFYGKPVPETPPPFQMVGCRGGGTLLAQDALLSFRRHANDPWSWATGTAGTLPTEGELRACDRAGENLHMVFAGEQTGEILEFLLDPRGHVRSVPVEQRRMGYYPLPPPNIAGRLRRLPPGSNAQGCEAVRGPRSAFYAWYEDENTLTILVMEGDQWRTIRHYPPRSRIECQQGGLGLFVGSEHGIDLIQPAVAMPTSLTARAPQLFPAPPKAPVGFRHGRIPAFRPHRIQTRVIYAWRSDLIANELSHGGPAFRFLDRQYARSEWVFEVSLQWDVGQAGMAYLSQSEQYRRLGAIPRHLRGTHGATPPISLYEGGLQYQASKQVYAALNAFLGEWTSAHSNTP